MHSPVVWLCFGIVVLLALSAQAGLQRNYHVIHQEAGPIFRSVLSSSGYRTFEPQVIGRRVQRQDEDDFNEEEDEEEEEEEDEEGEFDPDFSIQPPISGPGPFPPFDEEEEEEEEEEDEEEEEEEDGEFPPEDRFNEEEDIEGRQAYINNQYVSNPNSLRQNNVPKPQNNQNINNNNNKPVNNNNRRPPAAANRPNNNVANNNVAPNRPNKRRPTRAPNAARPAARPNAIRQGNGPNQQVNANRPPANNNRPNNNNRQKLQLRPVASSTQFIATPVADLILRLSISLAKPMGLSNSTNFNVPIRIPQGSGKNVVSAVLQSPGSKRANNDLPKPEIAPVSTVAPLNHEHEKTDADEHEEEKEDTLSMPATELPRK